MSVFSTRPGQVFRAAAAGGLAEKVIVGAGPRTIAVASGKGGVGKSSLTVNLSLCLARMGYRVMLFDADLGLANAEVLLGLIPRYDLHQVLYGDKELAEVVVQGPLGVNLISGGSGLLEMANLDSVRRQRLLKMLGQLNEDNDFILIDTGAGINKNVLGFVAAAEEVVVVVTPEPTSLTDAYALIKVLANHNVHSEVNLVINRAADRREAMRTLEKIQMVCGRFLEIKINSLGWIPEDRQVSEAIKKQRPFVITNPHAPASRGVATVAETLAGVRPATYGGFWNKVIKLFG